MEDTATLELLSARHYGYGVFQRLMGDEPTRELFDTVDGALLVEAFEIMGAQTSSVAALAEMMADPSADIKGLSRDYARIFVGPASLPAPPWESVYRDRKRVVMTATTLAVRDAYRAQGFIPARYPHVPDDHLALELDFLAALAKEAIEMAQSEECDQAKLSSIMDAEARFAADHLGAWVADFAADVQDKAHSAFYATAARALADFVAADVRG